MKDSSSFSSKDSSEPAAHISWAKEYQPWLLFARAMALVGKQVGPLMLAYWKICEWNPQHYLVTMHCASETFGMLAYPCEGTKAFARCFPLLAISVSLIVTGRFILQSRIYYHLLTKRAILDFQNYKLMHDPAVLLLAFCFAMGSLHFVLDIFYPPYLVNHLDKINNIAGFALPCVVFFVVFESGCNIEKHLVTLNKFYEDDADWAQEQLDGSKFFSEELIRKSAQAVQDRLQSNDDDFTLDSLLDETIRGTTVSHGHLTESNAQHSGKADLFTGLWPGGILLARGLTDSASKRFRVSMGAFMGTFAALHLVVLVLLVASAIVEFQEVRPNYRPPDALVVDGEGYISLGTGYCRDDSMQRPDCYWKEWNEVKNEPVNAKKEVSNVPVNSKRIESSTAPNVQQPKSKKQVQRKKQSRDNSIAVEPVMAPHDVVSKKAVFLALSTNSTVRRTLSTGDHLPQWLSPKPKKQWEDWQLDLCAGHCSARSGCIGFSIDTDFCTIYNSQVSNSPAGWNKGYETHTRKSSVRRTAQVVQTNKFELATCWKKNFLRARSHKTS